MAPWLTRILELTKSQGTKTLNCYKRIVSEKLEYTDKKKRPYLLYRMPSCSCEHIALGFVRGIKIKDLIKLYLLANILLHYLYT